MTEKVIGAFFKVYNTLGYGLAEKIYENSLAIELKAVRHLLDEHEAQLLNYLKATPVEVGLLLNFGPKAEHRRKVYDNELKGFDLDASRSRHTTIKKLCASVFIRVQ